MQIKKSRRKTLKWQKKKKVVSQKVKYLPRNMYVEITVAIVIKDPCKDNCKILFKDRKEDMMK